MVGSVGYCDSKGRTKTHAVFCTLDADPVVTISVHIRPLGCLWLAYCLIGRNPRNIPVEENYDGAEPSGLGPAQRPNR
jgi:hypothetical protein